MNEPSEQDKPENHGKNELDDGHHQPSLDQLTESWNKKAANRRDDISGGALSCHDSKSFTALSSDATRKISWTEADYLRSARNLRTCLVEDRVVASEASKRRRGL